jgi:toxin ParE1/3/4
MYDKWQVVYSEQAELDLHSIYDYINHSLFAPEVAKKQTRRILEGIEKLNQLPLRYQPYKKEPWLSKGLRVLPVDNYLVFYLPVESRKVVAVVRIMYGGRNIEGQLGLVETDI